jgi:aminoglycoside phosphotransferase (APT) family kinase protein
LNYLTTRCALRVLHMVNPELRLASISPARAAFTNVVRILECHTSSGGTLRLVVKLLTDDPEDAARRASAEFYGLKLARAHGIQAPEPLYLDVTGELLGVPGLLTRMVDGDQIVAPENITEWAETIADVLVKIHAVRPNEDDRVHLYSGNEQGLYFLNKDKQAQIAGHPLSDRIYEAVSELRPGIELFSSAFVHMDYWPGNLLWRDGRISAVLDWDSAAYGDPALDVANFRMEMYLRGIKLAADIFLNHYEAKSGSRVRNLGFWELACAARPLPVPANWTPASRDMGNAGATEERARTDYYEFVETAIRKGYEGM